MHYGAAPEHPGRPNQSYAGAPYEWQAPTPVPPYQQAYAGHRSDSLKSHRSFNAALLLLLIPSFVFGLAGFHRFYAGKVFTGILMLITGGGFLIWTIIDLIVLCTGGFRDAEGRLIRES